MQLSKALKGEISNLRFFFLTVVLLLHIPFPASTAVVTHTYINTLMGLSLLTKQRRKEKLKLYPKTLT